MNSKGLGLVGLMLWGGAAQAAGYALYEHSASALGNAFAGQSVVARDASTLFANPAGLTQVEGRQVVGGVQLIKSSVHFNDGNAATADGGDAGGLSPIPSFYYAMDLGKDVKVGVGVFAPFGLKTEYDTNWVGRASGILSDMKTINVNPTVAWKASERFSVGLGVDFQYIEATLSKGAAGGFSTTMEGDDTSWGYNLGILYDLDEATRLGLSYRSAIEHELKGDLTHSLAGYLFDIKAGVTLPDMASLALQRQLNDRWTVMLDATWTGWSAFDKLEVHRATPDVIIDTTQENWHDTWRFAVGADYRQNDTWTWRFGVAYDNTPVPDAARRTPRIPDSDRLSVAVGGQYRASKQTQVDFGYLHIFFHDSVMAARDVTTPAGTYEGQADILGVQLSYSY